MASRDFLKHVVSTSEPVGSTLGDQWYNPTTNILSARLAVNGTSVQWVQTYPVAGQGLTQTAGLQNFTDALSVASPNDTVPAASLTPTNGGYTNIDHVVAVKGTGAILAQVPDGTTTGGNKRGTGSVDFQMSRNSSSQVANGLYSVIAGGQNNTASGNYSTASGIGNTASGVAMLVVGNGNTGSGNYSLISGSGNTVNSQYSAIIAGFSNATSVQSSAILSGQSNTLTVLARYSVAIVTGSQNSNINNSDSYYGSAYGGAHNSAIVAGALNRISGSAQFIGSGWSNTTNGNFATVLGGHFNTSNIGSTTLGGYLNTPGTTYANRTQIVTTVVSGTVITLVSGTMPTVGSMWFSTGYGTNGDGNSGSWSYVVSTGAGVFTVSDGISFSRTSETTYWVPINVLIGSGGHNLATGMSATVLNGGQAGVPASKNQATNDYALVGNGTTNTASGSYSFIGSGSGNTASQSYTVVAGGQSNSAGAQFASVGGGTGNTANGTYSAVPGGYSSTAGGDTAFAMGFFNTAESSRSVVLGGRAGTARSIVGYTVFPASDAPIQQSPAGAHQAAILILARQTTTAAATVLTSNSSAAGFTNQVVLPPNSAYYIKGSVIATVTGGGATKAWSFEVVVKKGAGNANTSIVGSAIINVTAADAGASTWIIALTADLSSGGLAITVTGQAATTIRWVCKAETTEVTF
jgi:hypothetical protein